MGKTRTVRVPTLSSMKESTTEVTTSTVTSALPPLSGRTPHVIRSEEQSEANEGDVMAIPNPNIKLLHF